jgi:hypothetical protein
MEKTENAQALNRFSQKDLKGKDHLGNRGIDDRMLLKWFIKKWDVKKFIRLKRLRVWASGCNDSDNGTHIRVQN